MLTTIQGNWTITVETHNPSALPQRFIVTGAISGNGTYTGNVGDAPVFVVGNLWQVNIQAAADYDSNPPWTNSDIIKTQTTVQNGQYVFYLNSEDYIQDNSYDDLVLRFTQPIPAQLPPSVQPPIDVPPSVNPNEPPPFSNTPTFGNIPSSNTPFGNVPTSNNPAIFGGGNTPPSPVGLGMGKVFTRIEDGDKLPRQINKVTYGIWLDSSGNSTGNMLTFHTCSTELSSSFRRTIFQSKCDNCGAEPHFSIAYGHDGGSGSRDLGGNDFYTPTNAVYGQYRGLCLDYPQRRFMLGHKEMYHFYAINVARDRMGDKLDEGNLEINLAHLSGSQFGNGNAHTGSNVRLGNNTTLRLIDDSTLDVQNDLSAAAYSSFYRHISSSLAHPSTSAGKSFYVVSGTLETGIYNKSNPHVYGITYPQLGIVLLDADMLDMSASFLTTTGSDVAGDNAMKLFTSLSGSALRTDLSGDYLGLQSRKVKYEYVEQYFIRIKNQDYNFSNNPTFVTGSEGDIIEDFLNKSQVYISSIGLYNENKELLAVSKISRPILKNFTEEGLFEIQLTYN